MVSQEPVLFSGSIADNIAYGKYGRCGMEEIQAAAEAANAHEFIVELPDGYNTLVGDRGTLLSGGVGRHIVLLHLLLVVSTFCSGESPCYVAHWCIQSKCGHVSAWPRFRTLLPAYLYSS